MESKAPAGKVTLILMPQAGQSMEESPAFRVKQGDTITRPGDHGD
jgi:hypothetical protein